MRIIWTQEATEDFFYLLDEKLSKEIAEKWAAEIDFRISSLCDFPEKGRIIPEFNNKHLRETIYKGYRIIYKIEGNIYILGIINSRLKLSDLN